MVNQLCAFNFKFLRFWKQKTLEHEEARARRRTIRKKSIIYSPPAHLFIFILTTGSRV